MTVPHILIYGRIFGRKKIIIIYGMRPRGMPLLEFRTPMTFLTFAFLDPTTPRTHTNIQFCSWFEPGTRGTST